jgi:flagella basal body P-ring formation protein FlgA
MMPVLCLFEKNAGRAFFLAVALILEMSGAAPAFDLAVELPSRIEAREGGFYLGEYAVLDGERGIADSASMAVITPRGGSFSVNDVIAALAATDAAGRSVVLKMPDVVAVGAESKVASELRALTSWKWRIDVEGAEPGSGKFSLPRKVLPGSRSVTLKIDAGDGRKANKQVKLRWYQPVIYSVRTLERDEKIDRSSLRACIGVTEMTNELVWDVEQVEGSILRKQVAPGSHIALRDVESAAVVRLGSSVRLVAEVNGLGVEVNGVALQRGGVGDVIKVKNLSSRKILSGTVIDVGRVKINN